MGQTASHLNGMGNQLIKASKAGDADAVTELVSTNPQLLRFCTFRHLGPAHYAARGDHVEVLQQLVAKAQEVEQLQWQEAAACGAKVHARLFGTPLDPQLEQQHHRRRSSMEHDSLVKQVVNAASDRGITPLMLAVDGGCVASVKLLLEKGADPWAVDKLGGRTALHYAARSDNPELLQLLIEAAGSSGPVQFPNRPNTSYVDVRTQAGHTAVHFAVQSNSQVALAVLLNMGANPLLSSLFDCMDTINCSKGTTALHLAARQGNLAIAKQLMRAYVEHWYHRHLPDPRLLLDGDNFLPCQVAARRNHTEAAQMLLPTNPIMSLFAGEHVGLLGPPSLAAIAGAVLRATLAGDLKQLVQQEQQQGEQPADATPAEGTAAPDSAGAEGAEGSAAAPEHPATEAAAPAATPEASAELDSSADTDSCEGDKVCGVCFDVPPRVVLSPCGHQLCTDCCQRLLAMNSRCVMVCPFCRGGVGHLKPVGQACSVCDHAHAAAVAVHAPMRPEPAFALSSAQLVL